MADNPLISYQNNFAGEVNGSLAAAGWTDVVGTPAYVVASNQFVATTVNDGDIAVYEGFSNSNDQEMRLDFVLGDGGLPNPFLRSDDGSGGYLLLQNPGGDNQIYKRVASAYGALGPNINKAISLGDTIHLRFQTLGTTIRFKVWKNAASEPVSWDASITDSSVTTGKFGGFRTTSGVTTTKSKVTAITITDLGETGNYVDFSDSTIYWSGGIGGNWQTRGNNRIQTCNPGAYAKTVLVSGGSIQFIADVYAFLAAGGVAKLAVEVNGVLRTPVQITSSFTTVATGLSAGDVAKIYLYMNDETIDRWNNVAGAPASAIRVHGLLLDSGGTTSSSTILPKLYYAFGDSITEGVYANGIASRATGNNSTVVYAKLLADRFGTEWVDLGFGGTGWFRTGSGNVPGFGNTWSNFMTGQTRLTGGKFSPMPDFISINLGTNDNGDPTSYITTILPLIRAALTPSTPIYVFVPFGGFWEATIIAAVATVADAKIKVIDLGVNGVAIVAANSVDGVHPNVIGHQLLAGSSTSILYASGIRCLDRLSGVPGSLRRLNPLRRSA